MADDDDGTIEAAAERDPGFHALLEKLSSSYDFDFREYKVASLVRRIRGRMAQVHAGTFEGYATHLDERPEEHVAP